MTMSSKVLSLLEACFDLVSSPSMKIQLMGGKITENFGLSRRGFVCSLDQPPKGQFLQAKQVHIRTSSDFNTLFGNIYRKQSSNLPSTPTFENGTPC